MSERFISRELHDSIGQTMTAVVLELASLGVRQASGDDYQRARPGNQTVERRHVEVGSVHWPWVCVLRCWTTWVWVRLSNGRAGRFSRRLGIPVNVDMEGAVDDLPGRSHRTCIFRVVQEGSDELRKAFEGQTYSRAGPMYTGRRPCQY